MSQRLTETLTGAIVLFGAIGFLFYMTVAGGSGLRTSSAYDLTASFRSAEGVSLGTDIRLAGVRIGTVSGLELNTQTYRADVKFLIDDGIAIPDDSVVVVASEGLLGGTFVEIVPGGSFDNLQPGAAIVNTQGAVSVIGLLTQFVGGGDDL